MNCTFREALNDRQLRLDKTEQVFPCFQFLIAMHGLALDELLVVAKRQAGTALHGERLGRGHGCV